MDAEKLKAEFGKDLVFWGGGIDTQHVLASGSEDSVRREVRKNCELFMKDGGFVFNHIHNILPGIPPQNIIAMFEEVNSIRY
jgi:uroporphyrinogen decarboxylase